MSKKVQEYFKDYPSSDQCFESADGTLFHQEGHANLYQKESLKKKEPVKKHYRASEKIEAAAGDPGVEDVGKEADSETGESKKAAAKKAAAKKTVE